MHRILLSAAVGVLGLGLAASPAWAGWHVGGVYGYRGGYRGPVAVYRTPLGRPFSHGVYYPGWNYTHWTSRCWSARYGCYMYWCPTASCYYYWCGPQSCYYPISYIGTAPPVVQGPPITYQGPTVAAPSYLAGP